MKVLLRSPVFVQFVDCVWQISRQFPTAFEFNEQLLLAVVDHLYSCRFGTFLHNTERERRADSLATRTRSLWGHVADERGRVLNPLYRAETGVLHCDPSPAALGFWAAYYGRGSTRAASQDTVARRAQELDALAAQLEAECAELQSRSAAAVPGPAAGSGADRYDIV